MSSIQILLVIIFNKTKTIFDTEFLVKTWFLISIYNLMLHFKYHVIKFGPSLTVVKRVIPIEIVVSTYAPWNKVIAHRLNNSRFAKTINVTQVSDFFRGILSQYFPSVLNFCSFRMKRGNKADVVLFSLDFRCFNKLLHGIWRVCRM